MPKTFEEKCYITFKWKRFIEKPNIKPEIKDTKYVNGLGH